MTTGGWRIRWKY